MAELINPPWAIRMAETKRTATKGKSRRELDRLIAECAAADAATFTRYPDGADPEWVRLFDAAQEAARALADFAGPIVPRQEEIA